jgi:hypothetical protein
MEAGEGCIFAANHGERIPRSFARFSCLLATLVACLFNVAMIPPSNVASRPYLFRHDGVLSFLLTSQLNKPKNGLAVRGRT